MEKGERSINKKEGNILAAVERLAQAGGGIDEDEVNSLFGGDLLSELFPAIEGGYVISSGGRIYVRPSLMLFLARTGVLN